MTLSNLMKNIYTLFLIFSFLISTSTTAYSQTTEEKMANESILGLNQVKINAAALSLGNISLQYERAIDKKISVGIGLRFMPKSSLPLKSSIKSILDDDEAWTHIEKLKTGSFAITPEVRFYLGKSIFQGFYIAPFARYANYSAMMPYTFEYEHPSDGLQENTLPLDGKVSTFTGGFMIGSQWKLTDLIYLDWWILGPHYGSSNGNITGTKSLSFEEEIGLRTALQDLEDLPFVEGYEVDPNGARVNIKGPWGGVRAGLAIGIRF